MFVELNAGRFDRQMLAALSMSRALPQALTHPVQSGPVLSVATRSLLRSSTSSPFPDPKLQIGNPMWLSHVKSQPFPPAEVRWSHGIYHVYNGSRGHAESEWMRDEYVGTRWHRSNQYRSMRAMRREALLLSHTIYHKNRRVPASRRRDTFMLLTNI